MISKIYKNVRGLINLDKRDVLLTSFPKSGNTWLRFFLCNLILLDDQRNTQVDFSCLDSTMPELGYSDLSEIWSYKDFPRFVKTHKSYLPFFKKLKTVQVIRDPRDTMVSYFHYLAKNKRVNASNQFSDFIRHKKFGLEAWFKYHASWSSHTDLTIIYYEDLRHDDIAVFTELIKNLGMDMSAERIKKATLLSRADKIKKGEKEHGLSEKGNEFEKGFEFVRNGQSKQWPEYFSTEDLSLFKELSMKYSLRNIRYFSVTEEKSTL